MRGDLTQRLGRLHAWVHGYLAIGANPINLLLAFDGTCCSEIRPRRPDRTRSMQPPLHLTRRPPFLLPCIPTLSTGPCPPTVAGPYAAWMPQKSLHGRTCGVSRDGGRARALQPSSRYTALPLIYCTLQAL
ncbi:hypothetical protein XarbCFBP7629_10970 [Xanthomonas arboricola]|nr:hypothetical protein XarbCFBP7629_10970 [Xanthomonas arboricola]